MTSLPWQIGNKHKEEWTCSRKLTKKLHTDGQVTFAVNLDGLAVIPAYIAVAATSKTLTMQS